MTGANLKGADLQKADLGKAQLSESNLTYANLASANMSGADLRNAVLSPPPERPHSGGAGIPPPPELLRVTWGDEASPCALGWGYIVGSANLASASLSNADLTGAHLDGANLSSANLEGARLNGAFLRGANLSRANMANASLNTASLEGALIESAQLSGADLTDANLASIELCGAVFEPKTIPSAVRGLASAAGLDLLSYASNPDALVQLRKQFRDGGFEEQEKKVTYAIKKRQADLLGSNCGIYNPGGCVEYIFNRVLFDFTCQYGMKPGHALVLCFRLWLSCSILYLMFILEPGPSGLYRIYYEKPELKADPSAHRTVARIAPSKINERSRLGRIRASFVQQISMLGTAMFFSLMSTFNIGFREINFGRWLRLLTRQEFDIMASGWVRVIAGWQSLISVLLIALFILTFFGRPFG